MRATKLRWVSCLAPNSAAVYEFIARSVSEAAGAQWSFDVADSFAEFAGKDADVGFLCGLPYVRLTAQSPAPVTLLGAPVLSGERYGGAPVYFSDVVVSADAPWSSFDELRGRSWAYNECDSHSGYNVVRFALARRGISEFFSRVVAARHHETTLRMVAAGAVDASAIDSQVLAIELRNYPELRTAVRVIDVLGPSTIQPVVAAARLNESLRAALAAALIGLTDAASARAVLARSFIERFVTVEDRDYDDIRAMQAAADSAGVRLEKGSDA